ncbi:MAG: hypothetical protein JSR89_18015 [Proteobacteria bacterium]|nr:hypothetical protein [Pseudomonadota bacterium]
MGVDEKRLTGVKRAYDEVISDLFANKVPDMHVRESIASAVLFAARANCCDWEQMAFHTGSLASNLMQQRIVLVRDEERVAIV